jgi:hypothetical protein
MCDIGACLGTRHLEVSSRQHPRRCHPPGRRLRPSPDHARCGNVHGELVTDLIDAADRFDPEASEWLYSGYIDSATAEWALDARDELVALQATLEPSIVLLEL